MPRTHKLKCEHEYFVLSRADDKTCEIREDDRLYSDGDILEIYDSVEEPIPPGTEFIRRCVTHVLGEHVGLTPGYVALSTTLVPKQWSRKQQEFVYPEGRTPSHQDFADADEIIRASYGGNQ